MTFAGIKPRFSNAFEALSRKPARPEALMRIGLCILQYHQAQRVHW